MDAEYRNHVGYTLSAFDLLAHHMEALHATAVDQLDKDALGDCAEALAKLRTVISGLHYKYFQD